MASAYFGMYTSSVEDVDGDGVGDLAVASTGGTWGNTLWFFRGPLSGSLTTSDADATLLGGADVGLEDAVRLVPNLGGDGLGRLVAGGWGYSSEGGDGAVYVVSGEVAGTSDIGDAAAVRLRGEVGSSGKVEGLEAGDVDGDGQVDLLAGANAFISSSGNLGSGAVYLLYGPVSFTGVVEMSDAADARWYGGADYVAIGYSIATGDTNNDQHDDILFSGAPPDGTHRTGGAFFYYGEGI